MDREESPEDQMPCSSKYTDSTIIHSREATPEPIVPHHHSVHVVERTPLSYDHHLVINATTHTDEQPDALRAAKFRCNCHYPWLRELHALTALMMSNSLEEKLFWVLVILACISMSIVNTNWILRLFKRDESSTLITFIPVKKLKFPTLVFCPENADSLNYAGIYNDIYENIGYYENATLFNMMLYFIAGSGFGNVDVTAFDNATRSHLDQLVHEWRGNRTELELFDFVFVENGIRCDQLFDNCYRGGATTVDCCSIFEPTFVQIRGRCFRLKNDYYQEDQDEFDKMSIYFKAYESPLITKGISKRLLLYIGDEHPEVGIYPKYYLNARDWNRYRFIQRRVTMLPDNNACSTDVHNQGMATCMVYHWIYNVLIDPLNCTLPYYKGMLSYVNDVPVCEPSVVVENYASIMNTKLDNYGCLPACQRIENTIQIMNSIDYSANPPPFRIEASFTDLQYEKYEEVKTTSFASFISELGGQFGLFVGCSIMTFVQLISSIILFVCGRAKKFYRGEAALVWDIAMNPIND